MPTVLKQDEFGQVSLGMKNGKQFIIKKVTYDDI